MVQFTQSNLRQLGEQARAEYTSVVGCCYDICHTFGNMLIDSGLPHKGVDSYSVLEVRVGNNGQENHYVFKLNPAYFDKSVSDCVIDLSFDQFCDYQEDLGSVAVSYGTQDSLNSVYIYTKPIAEIDRYMTISQFLSESK